jgi:hypothetical protein
MSLVVAAADWRHGGNTVLSGNGGNAVLIGHGGYSGTPLLHGGTGGVTVSHSRARLLNTLRCKVFDHGSLDHESL